MGKEQPCQNFRLQEVSSKPSRGSAHRSTAGQRIRLILIAAATTFASAIATWPIPARALTTFENDYPNSDAELHNLANYEWWVDENDDDVKQIQAGTNDELMSSRGFDYRNCTDGASYWVNKYTGVSIPGSWGNAYNWDDSATSYTVKNGNANDIEPGDVAQSDDGNWGHVGFVTKVEKNTGGNVTKIEVAELNRNGTGDYTLSEYANKNTSGKFIRSGSLDWDHFIDLNGADKGLNNEDLTPDPDTDQDGIPDSQDQCPTVAGVAAYNGCPPPQISSSSVVAVGSQPHVFYYDVTNGNLRHGWWNPVAVAWSFEDFDGHTNTGYRLNADVGRNPTALVIGGQPHVFYYDATGGNLRHAWWNTGTSSWSFENFDGYTNTDNHVDADAGRDVTVTIYNSQPHLFYYDATNGNLRHSWWAGTAWGFENFDGHTNTNNHVDGNAGQYPSPVVMGYGTAASMHIYYYDTTNGNFRHNWWNGSTWTMVAADGATGTEGNLDSDLGQYTRAMEMGSQLHAYYSDVSGGNLRHMWWNTPTSSSSAETFDGTTSSVGGLNADVR